jgi:glutamate-1-semialdehyde aminotransferase
MDAERKFYEAVRHVRYDGVHISELTHEGVNICGRASISDLETIVKALRAYLEESVYKPPEE